MTFPVENYEVLTPANFIKRSVEVYPNKLAVVNGSRRFTYFEFNQRVNQLASALKKIGVQYGDKVAFICPNIPPMLEAHFAVPMIGASLVSINIRLSSSEVGYILNHSDAVVCFVDNEFASLVLPVMDQLKNIKTFVNICDISDDKPLNGTDYEAFLKTGSTDDVPVAVKDERDVATMLMYTSGTRDCRKG